MKSRFLPETDIANLAFRPAALKEKVLLGWLKPRQGRGSYKPYRQTSGDAVNRQLPLYPNGQVSTPWSKLEDLVRAKCRGDEQLISMNIPVAKATHDFATEMRLSAEPSDIRPLTLAMSGQYEFTLPLILRYDGGASVAFTDLRRTGQLTPHGRLVAYSIMHQRFRANFPDLEALRLEVWRYRNLDSRRIEVFRHDGAPLYSYDEISADFAETHSILNNLRAGTQDQRRASNDGNLGPLFGTA